MNRPMNVSSKLFVLVTAGTLSAAIAYGADESLPEIPSQENAMTSLTIKGPQGRLATFQVGAGDALPVLILHADSGRASQWTDVLGSIGKDRRVVAFDARGHGGSDPATDGDYGYAGRAADVAAVADALGLERFVVVGHSGGAAAALQYAANHADRVAGLLLVDPPTDPRALPQAVRDGFVNDLAGSKSLEILQAYYRSIAGSNPVVVDRVLADCVVVDPAARAGIGKALADWNPEPTLNGWKGPILILASSAGDNAAALYRLRPDVPYQVVAGAGHWLQLDQPDIVQAAIRRFVAGIGGIR